MVWERGKKKVLIDREDTELGSITIFLCILFLLFFSLTGVAFENVRVLSSQGYMRTAAYAAAMTVFGNYNKFLSKPTTGVVFDSLNNQSCRYEG